MSASWTDTLQNLRAWRRQRLPHAVFLGGALSLGVASSLGQPPSLGLLWTLPAAWLALSAFRLWDDLADRVADQSKPDRVRLKDPKRLAGVVALGVLGAACLAPGVVLLAAALAVFYRLRPAPWEPVLLLKYPALVGILRGEVDPPALLGGLLIYGAMLLDSGHRRVGMAVFWAGCVGAAVVTSSVEGLLLTPALAIPWLKTRPSRLGAVLITLILAYALLL